MNSYRSRATALVALLGRRRDQDVDTAAQSRQRGQVLPLFVIMSVVMLGAAALLVDVAWWWTSEQRMQRAADAGALAGAIYLPGREQAAFDAAIAEAKKNGYDDADPDVVVTPRRDPSNDRKLIVDIDAPVNTFFAKVFTLTSVDVSVTGAGEYTLPVPMGSPENYYGVFGILRQATYTETLTTTNRNPYSTGWRTPTSTLFGVPNAIRQWSNPGNVGSVNGSYASEGTNNEAQDWGSFGLSGVIPNDPSLVIEGVQLRLRGTYASGFNSECRLEARVSWDAGNSWSSPVTHNNNLGTSGGTYLIPQDPSTSLPAWDAAHAWTRGDFTDTNFRVRLTWRDNYTGCPDRTVFVDELSAAVSYSILETSTSTNTTTTNDPLRGPGTACANGAAYCFNPDGSALNPRGFWATMNTRGASNVNGDAHQPRYDRAPDESGATVVAPDCPVDGACHDPDQYYNYAVEMPPGSTNGRVYVFDPGFCATSNNRGTGDRWFGDRNAVSSWYELKEDYLNTPYDLSDDRLVASTGSLFTNMDAADSTMGGSGGAECRKSNIAYGDGRDYHLSWYLLNPDPGAGLSGGADGTIYRVHTTGTDPVGNANNDTNGEQSFALYVSADGGAPRIYGLAAMQMFTPLSSNGGSTSSEFYLAQIEAAHAGKTVELKLWDPGDTSPLRANLQILIPQELGGWAPSAELDYSAEGGTTHSSVNQACNSNSGTNVSQIWSEETGNQPGEFNGCWLTIHIPIPVDYTATEDGWWKIRYNMTGSGTSNDVTTWKVRVLGNPVHLVPE